MKSSLFLIALSTLVSAMPGPARNATSVLPPSNDCKGKYCQTKPDKYGSKMKTAANGGYGSKAKYPSSDCKGKYCQTQPANCKGKYCQTQPANCKGKYCQTQPANCKGKYCPPPIKPTVIVDPPAPTVEPPPEPSATETQTEEPPTLPPGPESTEVVSGIAGSATEATPEATIEATPEATIEATTVVTPEVTSSQAPSGPSETLPPVLSNAFSVNAVSSMTSILFIISAFF